VLKDDQCAVQGMDSVEIHFVIREREVDYNLLPPNVFTPNGDDYNAYFYVPEIPEDNCHRQFRKVQIFNRWGKLVFSSESRNFKWDGRGSSNGVYFYFLDFGEVTFKGTLTLLR
jgi:gliding motility-associated-like protein